MMIDHSLAFDLPQPWQSKKFETKQIGSINFLVGPNGSGKSQFARTLKSNLPKCRLLSTDRLKGMERDYFNFIGDHFSDGLQKGWFPQVKEAGKTLGSGLDTFILLEQKLELKIKVEATLSHLFDRRIFLDWESGFLVARASLGTTGTRYRLDKDECHGIKELLVLLTHIYNDDNDYLIIDEPELHLHPQYQSFFIREVRKIAGNPATDPTKKVVFLITHSPFILDLAHFDDVKSILSFDLQHSIPRNIADIDSKVASRIETLTPRLNVEHRQLFFADNPIFVEGAHDAQIVHVMQECRDVAISGAGSCVIVAGGNEEVTKFLELSTAFGKKAYFLYDLDSLFLGNLRGCVQADGTVTDFLASLGLGGNFSKYCGQLDKAIGDAINKIREAPSPLASLKSLRDHLDWLADGKPLADKKLVLARLSVLTQLGRDRESIVQTISNKATTVIEGYLGQIVAALKSINVYLLLGGSLEHYLPSYAGDVFRMSEESKRAAVNAETELMMKGMTEVELKSRYGVLFDAVRSFPAKPPADIDKLIIDYLSDYVHELQGLVVRNPAWDLNSLRSYFSGASNSGSRLFQLERLDRQSGTEFTASILVPSKLAGEDLHIEVSNQTNAGMRDIRLRPVEG